MSYTIQYMEQEAISSISSSIADQISAQTAGVGLLRIARGLGWKYFELLLMFGGPIEWVSSSIQLEGIMIWGKFVGMIFGLSVTCPIQIHNRMPLEETLETYNYFIAQVDQLGLAYIAIQRYSEFNDPIIEGAQSYL